jgi:Arc/MetJ family transcription regulator
VGYDHEKIGYPFALLEGAMPTVQMTLDDVLIQEIDQVVKELGTTRSAFAREAFRAAIAQVRRQAMERRHGEGYARQPVQPGEFSDWEDEQVWVE